jgi:hypothetical protein
MRSWIGATNSLAGTVMTANVRFHLSVTGLCQFSHPGDAKRLAITPRNRVAFSGAVLLKEAVHRHDASTLAVGVAEPLVLGDRFGSCMDWREFRTFLAEVRDQAPTQKPSTGRPVSGSRR